MKTFWLALFCASSVFCALGEERTINSPNKKFSAVLTSSDGSDYWFDKMVIQDDQNNILFSTNGHGLSDQLFEGPFTAEHVLWSPDSTFVAATFGYSHYMLTVLFCHRSNIFVQVPIPDLSEHEDNPQIVPIKWISGRRLILDISGPHAGHNIESFYHGRATIRVLQKSLMSEVLYKYMTETRSLKEAEQGAAANP